ncbi:MAG: cation transporter, partial [Lachnospiraceae bacterium]
FSPLLIKASWFHTVTPYLDQIVAIILSFFMLPTPVCAVVTGLRDLFLLAPEEETVTNLKEIITPILYAYGYEHLYFDIVRTGRKLWISVYITFDQDEVSISRFRIVQNFVIQALKKEYQDFYFELLPEIEFSGESNVEA